MRRVETSVGQQVYEWLFSSQAQQTMVALAKLSAAVFGTNTIANGFSCSATSPASMSVKIGAGEIYQMESLEANTCGTLPADTTHTILKQGILLDSYTTATFTAPGTTGQSINYLIEAQYQDSDISLDPTTGSSPVVLQFYDSDNPAVPWSGPNNSGATSNTFRDGIVSFQIKAGIAAATGSQTTPAPDAGYVGLWVVTVANGQSTITSGNISQYSGAPLLPSDLLHGIQAGSFNYAVDTGTANAYVATLIPAVSSPGDNLHVRFKVAHANTGASTLNGSPLLKPNLQPLTGGELILNSIATAQWNYSLNGGAGAYVLLSAPGGSLSNGRLLNIQVISATGTYTPTAGMTSAIVEIVGGGGGGGGIPATTSGNQATSGGGASGSYAKGWFTATTIGASVSCTIGAAGPAGAAGQNAGGNGGTTSFGALLSAPGGNGGQSVASTSQGTIAYINGGSPGAVATGGNIINSQGQPGGLGFLSNGFIRAGDGAPSVFGGGSRGAAATSPGSGGSGNAAGSSGASSAAGFAGAPGLIIVYEYSA